MVSRRSKRGPGLSLKQWFGWGFLAGLLYAVVTNPLGCLAWSIILTILSALVLFAIIDVLSPAWLVVLIVGVVFALALGGAFGSRHRHGPHDEP